MPEIIWNYVIMSHVVIYAYIASDHKAKCSDASFCTCVMVCHINAILFFSVVAPSPPPPKENCLNDPG